jgi:hypothetical protein
MDGLLADSQPGSIDGANEIFSALNAHVEKLVSTAGARKFPAADLNRTAEEAILSCSRLMGKQNANYCQF